MPNEGKYLPADHHILYVLPDTAPGIVRTNARVTTDQDAAGKCAQDAGTWTWSEIFLEIAGDCDGTIQSHFRLETASPAIENPGRALGVWPQLQPQSQQEGGRNYQAPAQIFCYAFKSHDIRQLDSQYC